MTDNPGVIRNGKVQPPSYASMVGGCCHDCLPWSEPAVTAKDAEHVIRAFLSFQAARELLEAGEERFATAPLTESMPSFLDKLPDKEIIVEGVGRARMVPASTGLAEMVAELERKLGEAQKALDESDGVETLEISPWDECESEGMQWVR